MSTDTAFVLGILALFGPRCPDRLRLFLLTLAIVDDIGAITVMALFYTDDVDVDRARRRRASSCRHCWALRWAGVWRLTPYVLVGIALWVAVQASGVHPTLAGVLRRPAAAGQATRTRTSSSAPASTGRPSARRRTPNGPGWPPSSAHATVPPGARLLLVLHRWTAYAVVPVFGLANAGVALDAETLREAATSPVTIGVAVALLVGNAIGITAGTAVALRTGLGVLPGGVRWSHLWPGRPWPASASRSRCSSPTWRSPTNTCASRRRSASWSAQ